MINFTGQTRKRNINLGDRRLAGVSGTSFLDRTKAQRHQRELQRLQTRSANVIVVAVSRYLELRRQADSLVRNWMDYGPKNELQFQFWACEFMFLAKYSFRYWPEAANFAIEKVLNVAPSWKLGYTAGKSLVEGALLLNLAPNALDLVLLVLNCDRSQDSSYPDVLGRVISSPGPATKLHSVAYTINGNDLEPFVTYLSRESDLPGDIDVLNRVFSTQKAINLINTVDDYGKLQLLINYLRSHSSSEFSVSDYFSLGGILSTIAFSVFCEGEPESPNSFTVSKANYSLIMRLYESDFIDKAITLLDKTSTSKMCLNIITALLHLIPENKTKICLVITVIPNSFTWFYDNIKLHSVYKEFEETIESGKDYIPPQQFKVLYEDNNDYEKTQFWKGLFTFEELYSYWLIVSNDLESFNPEKLSLKEIKLFSGLLKVLCLSLIFYTKTQGKVSTELNKLESTSVSLINQFYRKTLRLKVLDKLFWKATGLDLNVDSMIQALAEAEDQDSDAENEESNTKFNSKLRLSSSSSSSSSDISAKLEILNKLPFVMDFDLRVQIFRSLIELDRQSRSDSTMFAMFEPPKLQAEIRRDHLLEDAFQSFSSAGPGFKNKIHVTFFDKYGQREAGIDGGGITKEFLNSVVAEGFHPKAGLFKESAQKQLYPNEEIYLKAIRNIDVEQQKQSMNYFRFLGNIVGKCLYENVLIDISFAPFFLNKWCSSQGLVKNSINDLSSLDEELYVNLMKLMKMSDSEVILMDLSFMTNHILNNNQYTFPLMGQGTTPVTGTNKLLYIHQLANFKLNTTIDVQAKKFLEGVFELISARWLRIFDSYELQMLISGSAHNIDVNDWKQNLEYGGYFDDDETVTIFWDVIEHDFNDEQKGQLLKFVTSVSRPPLLGFSSLSPRFGIRNAYRDMDRLPTASTCVNLLKLPDYRDRKVLKEKLLLAISMNSGFDLS